MDRLTFWLQKARRDIELRKAQRIKESEKAASNMNTLSASLPASSSGDGKEQKKLSCHICRDAGYLRVDVPLGHIQFGKAIPCQCSIKKSQQKQQQHLIELAGLQTLERFRHATFETYNPFLQGVSEAYIKALEFAKNPVGWLVFVGGYGCGKTHLAIAIAKKQIEENKLVMFHIVPRLLDDLRSTFSPTSEHDYTAQFQHMCTIPMLILDDFGAQNNTPWANDKLFQLLNHRYNAYLPTVVTMNTTAWEHLEPRIYSRFQDKQLVQVLIMDQAQDYRIHGP